MAQIPTANGLWGDDASVLAEIGRRLAQERLNRNWSQARLAKEAGISLSTLKRLEAGGSTQMSALIRVLRALGLLDNLDALLPQIGQSPLDAWAMRGKPRRRASPQRSSPPAPTKEPWQWGEES